MVGNRITMIRKIYFMGIKGVGMASLALIARQAGFIVSGSDVADEFITDKVLKDAGIEVLKGFTQDNPKNFFGTTPAHECMMIITGAHDGFDNEEVKGNAEIKTITHGEAVGLFMSGKLFERSDMEGISVAGAHGKTSLSAMLATFLTKLNLDPSYSVGTSEIIPIGASGHYGRGKYFVAEADEYRSAPTDPTPKFLYQYPKYLIINNIDFDHPDFFKDIEAVKNAFAQFVENLTDDGVLIVNGDDENVMEIIKSTASIKGTTSTTGDAKVKVITYGTSLENDFIISNYQQVGLESHFSVSTHGTLIGRFKLSVPGYHNAKNVLAAIALLTEIGISVDKIEKVLPAFGGSKRRLEIVGQTSSGATIIDDYAHHPEEIRKTLEAIKLAYPNKKIIVVFQAHTFGRTKALVSEFVASFASVNELIILPTFASARDLNNQDIEQDRDFVEKIRPIQSNVKLIESRSDVVKYLSASSPESIIITMGAGDVYKVGQELIAG